MCACMCVCVCVRFMLMERANELERENYVLSFTYIK